MRNIVAAVAVALAACGLAVACSVDFDTSARGKFQCETSDDCLGNQVCRRNSNGVRVCRGTGPVCVDDDQDGYGAPGTDRSSCPACQNGRRNGCEPDMCDNDPNKHPGKVEKCDGIDNDCDGVVAEEEGDLGAESCAAGGDAGEAECPFGTGNPPPQQGTLWGCKTFNGNPQCVLKGSFNGNQSCQNLPERDQFGTCEKTNGSWQWTDVPDECSQP